MNSSSKRGKGAASANKTNAMAGNQDIGNAGGNKDVSKDLEYSPWFHPWQPALKAYEQGDRHLKAIEKQDGGKRGEIKPANEKLKKENIDQAFI